MFAWCSTNLNWRHLLPDFPGGRSSASLGSAELGSLMSLFIASLAFGEGNLLDMSKIGSLAASVGAGIAGSLQLSTQKSSGSFAQVKPSERTHSCCRHPGRSLGFSNEGNVCAIRPGQQFLAFSFVLSGTTRKSKHTASLLRG